MSAVARPLGFLTLSPQEEQRPQQDQQQQQQQQPPPQRRPTLGPSRTPPSLSGPKTASTTDPRKLARVRTIYIERIDNALDEKLTAALAKIRRFRFVGERKEADAIMNGTCFDSRRLKLLRSEVYLHDQSGASIWQDSVRRPIKPPTIEVAATETADVIAAHLSESLTEAERH
jgi:hemolysin activation/secretion protein